MKREKVQMNWTETEEKLVEEIVTEWNTYVTKYENQTIEICQFIHSLTITYPESTIKEIIKKVNQHPNIKRMLSPDRIYQGIRLINKRKDLIEYHKQPKDIPEEKKPYLKQDGSVFWEFYFELEKSGLNDGIKTMLEYDGKKENWSYRKLKEKIWEAKEEVKNHEPGYTKKEKQDLIRQITGMIRNLEIHHLRGIFTLVKDFLEEERLNKDKSDIGEQNAS